MQRRISVRMWKKFGEPVGKGVINVALVVCGAMAWLIAWLAYGSLTPEDRARLRWKRG